MKCNLCPRKCNIDRSEKVGFCGCNDKIKISRAALHYWEEPCISGENGSGTIFFSGCQLRCVFCQNAKISSENFGKEITIDRLAEIFLELQSQNANNINLVSPTPYVPQIIVALQKVKGKLHIPVVYNSSGYESLETIKSLAGYVDIYLPDMKYFDNALASDFSNAKDYFEVASQAIELMFSQVGKIQLDDKNILQKGLIIRHLVLPNNYKDSIKVMEYIEKNFNKNDIFVSVMSQYTPAFKAKEMKNLNRRIFSYEYHKVMDCVENLGLIGFMQEKSSAKEEYTPPFDLYGV